MFFGQSVKEEFPSVRTRVLQLLAGEGRWSCEELIRELRELDREISEPRRYQWWDSFEGLWPGHAADCLVRYSHSEGRDAELFEEALRLCLRLPAGNEALRDAILQGREQKIPEALREDLESYVFRRNKIEVWRERLTVWFWVAAVTFLVLLGVDKFK